MKDVFSAEERETFRSEFDFMMEQQYGDAYDDTGPC